MFQCKCGIKSYVHDTQKCYTCGNNLVQLHLNTVTEQLQEGVITTLHEIGLPYIIKIILKGGK